MNSRSPNTRRSAAFVLAVLVLGVSAAKAQRYVAADIVYVPVPAYGHMVPTPFATSCYPYCAAVVVRNRALERRQQRFDALRADAPASEVSFGPIATAKPTTARQSSDEELLPAYRTAGKVRPEFDGTGKYTGPYAELEISTAPPAEATPGSTSPAPSVPPAPQPKRRAQPMLPCPKGAPEC